MESWGFHSSERQPSSAGHLSGYPDGERSSQPRLDHLSAGKPSAEACRPCPDSQ